MLTRTETRRWEARYTLTFVVILLCTPPPRPPEPDVPPSKPPTATPAPDSYTTFVLPLSRRSAAFQTGVQPHVPQPFADRARCARSVVIHSAPPVAGLPSHRGDAVPYTPETAHGTSLTQQPSCLQDGVPTSPAAHSDPAARIPTLGHHARLPLDPEDSQPSITLTRATESDCGTILWRSPGSQVARPDSVGTAQYDPDEGQVSGVIFVRHRAPDRWAMVENGGNAD